jgi:hypothetical protein
MAGACLLPDAQPLSSGAGNPERESGRVDGLAANWKQKELAVWRKGGPAKPAIVERLRKETTLPRKGTAARAVRVRLR